MAGNDGIPPRERGAGLISVIFGILILAIVVGLVVKVGPVYYDSYALQNIIQDQAKQVRSDESAGQIVQDLQDRFHVALIRVPDQDIRVDNPQGGPLRIEVDFRRVVPLWQNASLLLDFHLHN